MKEFLVFILIFCIGFRPLVPLLEYSVNYEYISTELCENKDKPELHCNGKCHLKKQIEKNAKEESKKENQINKIKLVDLFFKNEDSIPIKYLLKFKKSYHSMYENNYSFTFQNSFFKPPIFC